MERKKNLYCQRDRIYTPNGKSHLNLADDNSKAGYKDVEHQHHCMCVYCQRYTMSRILDSIQSAAGRGGSLHTSTNKSCWYASIGICFTFLLWTGKQSDSVRDVSHEQFRGLRCFTHFHHTDCFVVNKQGENWDSGVTSLEQQEKLCLSTYYFRCWRGFRVCHRKPDSTGAAATKMCQSSFLTRRSLT